MIGSLRVRGPAVLADGAMVRRVVAGALGRTVPAIASLAVPVLLAAPAVATGRGLFGVSSFPDLHYGLFWAITLLVAGAQVVLIGSILAPRRDTATSSRPRASARAELAWGLLSTILIGLLLVAAFRKIDSQHSAQPRYFINVTGFGTSDYYSYEAWGPRGVSCATEPTCRTARLP